MKSTIGCIYWIAVLAGFIFLFFRNSLFPLSALLFLIAVFVLGIVIFLSTAQPQRKQIGESELSANIDDYDPDFYE